MFWSKDNARFLYGLIQKGLEERYRTRIDDSHMQHLVSIMEMVMKPLPKLIPADVDKEWFVRGLNKQVLQEALPIFADLVKEDGTTTIPPTPPANPSATPAVPARNVDPMGHLGAPRYRTPTGPDNGDPETLYQRMEQERNPNASSSVPPIPNFEDAPVDYPENVNDLYEVAEKQRSVRDIMAPPATSQALPFQPQDGFQVRAHPTDYRATEATSEDDSSLANSTSLADLLAVNRSATDDPPAHFDPDRFHDGPPPRGAERALQQRAPVRVAPPPPLTNAPVHDDEIALRTGARLTFGDDPPQPAEMRTLIAKTSRNIIHDSQSIPHIYVLNSRDRNTAIQPNPSDYRIELRSPYLEVVSVELVGTALPLSAYNMNSTNNKLYFQEVDGGTLLEATIPVGNYPDAATLATTAATALMGASVLGATYSGTVDTLTDKITLTSDGGGGAVFTLVFFGQPTLEGEGTPEFRREKPQYPPQSAGPALGFDTVDYSGALMYEAPFVTNLDGDPSVFLHIEELELLEANNAEVHDSFAEIEMLNIGSTGTGPGYARFFPSDNRRYIKYFSPPKGKLAWLTVSFRTANGELWDFNGRDHILTFQIITRDKTQGPYDENVHPSGHHN
jgi:hypothetical protein